MLLLSLARQLGVLERRRLGLGADPRAVRPHVARAPAGAAPAADVVAGGRLRVPARGRALPSGLPAAGLPGHGAGRHAARAGAGRDRRHERARLARRRRVPRPGSPRSSAWPSAVVAAYVVTLAAVAQAALARLLLDPREAQLAAEVADLRRSRVDLVDAFETERRRIERDLHDGVQQRLVALTMTLGRAELDVPDGPGLVAVQDAHRQAEEALWPSCASTIRGIHPRVLVDHGLAAAVHELADRCLGADQRRHPAAPTGCRRRSSRRRTSWSARRSPTSPGTPGPAGRRCTAGCAATTFVLTVEDDGVGGAPADGSRQRAGRARASGSRRSAASCG